MRPHELIHNIQRQPLKVCVMSTARRLSWANLSMAGLTEAVVRTSKGTPYPITTSQKFNITADGDFVIKVTGIIKLIAMGSELVSQVILRH